MLYGYAISFNLFHFYQNSNLTMLPPPLNSIEEDLDFIIDLMRNYDAVWIRHQFQSYIKPSEEIKPGD